MKHFVGSGSHHDNERRYCGTAQRWVTSRTVSWHFLIWPGLSHQEIIRNDNVAKSLVVEMLSRKCCSFIFEVHSIEGRLTCETDNIKCVFNPSLFRVKQSMCKCGACLTSRSRSVFIDTSVFISGECHWALNNWDEIF